MAGKKRVACFYRVSTKSQLTGDDIPMQKNACREFARKMGWTIVAEYTEKGVSGYKVSANERDEIQRAKRDAERGLFDVLLCFMFDRLGRRQDETPFVVKWFASKGIEIWSVKEGQQKFEDHADDLINFIRYWQSSGESQKTAMRVTEKHEQMVKAGLFRGGDPPYGYKLVPSGITNKKGKELMKLAIDEVESEIVRMMYDLVYEKGYGAGRIVQVLNEKAKEDDRFKSRTGGKWNTGVVNYILRNPIYKGYLTFGKRRYENDGYHVQDRDEWILSERPIEELVIVDEHVWNRVQEIRSSRTPEKVRKNGYTLHASKSPLLFVGAIKCGHCGSPLTTTYNTKTYVTSNGEMIKKREPKYRCSGKALGKTDCDGQTIYSQNKIETVVLEQINKYLEQLKSVDFTKEITEYKMKNLSGYEKELKTQKKKLNEAFEELTTLKNEIAKSLMGKSLFKPEMLHSLIEEKEKEIDKINLSIRELEEILEDKESSVREMEQLQKYIPVWKDVFASADYEKKKMMLSNIIDEIIVRRDGLELNLKLSVSQFIQSVANSEDNDDEGRGVEGYGGRGSAFSSSGRALMPNALLIQRLLTKQYKLKYVI